MASSEAYQAYGIQRQDLRAAIAKSLELRALHAALLQGSSSSPATVHKFQFVASPSLSRSSHQLSAEDYPVFTPSYDDEPLPGYQTMLPESQSVSGSWNGIGFEEESKYNGEFLSEIKSLHRTSSNQFSKRSSCTNNVHDALKTCSRRTNSSEFKSIDTYNNAFRPVTREKNDAVDTKSLKDVSTTKHKGALFSWKFPRLMKKPKSEPSPNAVESEDMSQILKNWGVLSIENLKKELLVANENKDAALAEVSDMKTSLGELQHKMVSLESYCEELKKALKKATQGKETYSKRSKSIVSKESMPVSDEVMIEGFLQVVSEARLSVKQFCKTLINQIEEDDGDILGNLNSILQPNQFGIGNKYSKGVLYHLESLINNSFYQDFENCIFQRNGSPKILDPVQDRLAKFSSFVALRSLSWNEALNEGSKYYDEDFTRFCDQKMRSIVSVLNWSKPWEEQLLQSFFVSAKCIWLLHLLAFSFGPPLVILRVEDDRNYDPLYMEDVLYDKQEGNDPAKVKIMVMPGFYVRNKVLKCRVLCRYRSVP